MLKCRLQRARNHNQRVIPLVLLQLICSIPILAGEQKSKQDSTIRKSSALTECQQEVERLKSENFDLQKKLNEILIRQLEAMKKPSEAESNALASVKALGSVVDSSSHGDFSKYLLDAKVKVESLSPGPRKEEMNKVLLAFIDIDSAWRLKNSRIGLFSSKQVEAYSRNFLNICTNLEKNPASFQRRTPPEYAGYSTFYYPDAVLSYMAHQAKEMAVQLTISN